MTEIKVNNRRAPRFVVIEKGNRYTQFIGKFRNMSVESSFPMSRRDLESFRQNPVGFLALCNAMSEDEPA